MSRDLSSAVKVSFISIAGTCDVNVSTSDNLVMAVSEHSVCGGTSTHRHPEQEHLPVHDRIRWKYRRKHDQVAFTEHTYNVCSAPMFMSCALHQYHEGVLSPGEWRAPSVAVTACVTLVGFL